MKKYRVSLYFLGFCFILHTEGSAQTYGLQVLGGAKMVIQSGINVSVVNNSGTKIDGASSSVTNNGTLAMEGSFLNQNSATVQGNGNYRVGGNWNNLGTFNAGGSTVQLIGNNPATINAGSNPNFYSPTMGMNSFYNLILIKDPTNPVVRVVSNPLKVSLTLAFLGVNNKLQLDDLDFMTSSFVSGGSPTNYIITNGIGKAILNFYPIFSTEVHIGTSATSYTPITVTITDGASPPKYLGVRVRNQVLSNATTGTPFTSGVVNKSWELTEIETPSPTNMTIMPQWSSTDELMGFNRAACSVVKWNSTSSAWNQPASAVGASSGANPYTRTRSGITSLGIFAVGSSNAILPLNLLDFTAKFENTTAFLEWTTTAERNISHFDIEKSVDSKSFLKIAEIKANNTPSVYSAIDAQFFTSSYYRLKINELDGKSNYSKIVFLEKNSDKNLKIIRDTEGSVLIETNDKIELITVTNSIGQLIKSTKEKRFLIDELNAGIYIVAVKTDKGFLSKKIFKN